MKQLESYKHIKYSIKPNKNKIPKNCFTFDDLEEFNEIYLYAKTHYKRVKHTKSQGISNKREEKFYERYFIVKGNQRFELVIICYEGCYRFLLQNKKHQDNTISGQQACRELYKWCDNYNIDLTKYATDVDQGLIEKSRIEKPHIEILTDIKRFRQGESIPHVYHMDFRSSYASRISEAIPELKPMYEDIFSHRKENNGYYKHVLTNSIGCWQSPYCVDYNNRRTVKPYEFAYLSKIAINGTRAKVEEKIAKLKEKGFIPLVSNTDGIWYYSPTHEAYHDNEEGDNLGNWQNDHKDCIFCMTSKGAYQFIENNKVTSVVRGICNLDAVEPDRSKWQFKDILRIKEVYAYKFDENIGVYKDGETI